MQEWRRDSHTSLGGILNERVSFSVPGLPVSQGSLAFKGMRRTKDGRQVPVITHSNSRSLTAWRDAVAWAARAAQVEMAPKHVPVAVEMLFRRPRAASNRDTFPTIPPDVDKLQRAILDALTGIAYVDDAQVVRVVAEKVYGPAGAEIAVVRLGLLG